MDKVTFFRWAYVEKDSSISNPLYLPNSRGIRDGRIKLDDSYGLPFLMSDSKGQQFRSKDLQMSAKRRRGENAYPKQLMDLIAIGVRFDINELTFPLFLNKIRHPYYVNSSTLIFISSFQELFHSRPTQFHIKTKDLTQDDLKLLSVKIGERNSLGRFIYRDFIVPNGEIEGNPRPLSERK